MSCRRCRCPTAQGGELQGLWDVAAEITLPTHFARLDSDKVDSRAAQRLGLAASKRRHSRSKISLKPPLTTKSLGIFTLVKIYAFGARAYFKSCINGVDLSVIFLGSTPGRTRTPVAPCPRPFQSSPLPLPLLPSPSPSPVYPLTRPRVPLPSLLSQDRTFRRASADSRHRCLLNIQ